MKSFDTREELLNYCKENNYIVSNSTEEIIEFIKNNRFKHLYLRGADLRAANFKSANIYSCDLYFCDLTGAIYSNNTIFPEYFDVRSDMVSVDKCIESSHFLESNSKVYSEIAKIQQNRSQMHGAAQSNFKMIAKLWSAYTGATIDAKDVGFMMAMLKAARHKGGDKNNLDNFVDAANYIALAGDF